MHPEVQYLNLARQVIRNGVKTVGRNGTTYTSIGAMMRFPLNNGTIPLLTTKKLAWRSCLKELFWFMRGETDNKKTSKSKCKNLEWKCF